MGPNAKPAIPALAKAVRDRDAEQAIRVLGSIGPDALPALTEILKEATARSANTRPTRSGAWGRAQGRHPRAGRGAEEPGAAGAAGTR